MIHVKVGWQSSNFIAANCYLKQDLKARQPIFLYICHDIEFCINIPPTFD